MSSITLSTDGYFVSGTTNVSQDIPLTISGTTANTYTLPGDVTVPTGATFPGYTVGTKFTIINDSNQTQTFQAASGYTLAGPTTATDGSSTPTRRTFYFVGNKTWNSF